MCETQGELERAEQGREKKREMVVHASLEIVLQTGCMMRTRIQMGMQMRIQMGMQMRMRLKSTTANPNANANANFNRVFVSCDQ